MKKTLTFQDKYDAYKRNDSRYEGTFITAVKTTGVFCRPSCRARTPKPENIIFFDSTHEAIQHGFRPCLLCKPMENMDETPKKIRAVITELQKNPDYKIKDYDLRKRGIEPNQIRRWFKKHHNMTFHAYQRMLRINTAFNSIKSGKTVTNSAFESGYDSLSGFNEGYRSIFGAPATQSHEKSIINITRFTTPIGPMFACASNKGLCLLDFTDRKTLETEFKSLCRKLNAIILPGENLYLAQAQSELHEYFSGQRKVFTVSLHTPGTTFQKQAWKALQEIPYGAVRSYKQQAVAINNPKAVRAIASANSHNRINIIIPCHRVMGSNGQLIGYGGGLHRKKWLLNFEASSSITSDA